MTATATKPWRDRLVSELMIPTSLKAHVVKHTIDGEPVKTWGDIWDALEQAADIGLGVLQERVREQIQKAIDEETKGPVPETKQPETAAPKPEPTKEQPMADTGTKGKKQRGKKNEPEAAAEPNPEANGKHTVPAPPPASVKSQFELAVSFGGVSIGDKTCRIGVKISREAMTINQADERLCDRRLSGQLMAKPGNSQAAQTALPTMEDADLVLAGAFDVKGFRVTTDEISSGLTFQKKGTDIKTLSQMANRDGRVVIERVEAIPEGESEEPEADDAAEEGDEPGEEADQN